MKNLSISSREKPTKIESSSISNTLHPCNLPSKRYIRTRAIVLFINASSQHLCVLQIFSHHKSSADSPNTVLRASAIPERR